MTSALGKTPSWNLLSNHGRVLLCISEDPSVRVRDIAARLGLTERSVRRIVADLETAGYLSHERIGNRNRYAVAAESTTPGVDVDVETIVSVAGTSGGEQ